MQGDFFLTTWFLEGMKWVYSNVHSVFFTILICTIVLRSLTIFSDIATRKSQAKMNAVQPELQRIQKKYANDPVKAQQASRKLMADRGVSMWGSCLPLLITMPLFFCFIAAFRFWGYEETIKLLTADNAAELLRSFKFLWVNNIWQPDNGLSPVIQEGSKFLANSAQLNRLLYLQNNPDVWEKLVQLGVAAKDAAGSYSFLTTDAAVAAYNEAVQPLLEVYTGHNNGWFILPLLAGGTQFLANWIMQKGQPAQDPNNPAASTTKMMLWMFPIMSAWFCLTYNAAFAVYWILTSIFMVLVNIVLNKKFPRGAAAEPKEGEKK